MRARERERERETKSITQRVFIICTEFVSFLFGLRVSMEVKIIIHNFGGNVVSFANYNWHKKYKYHC